jgi:hypothetical protein
MQETFNFQKEVQVLLGALIYLSSKKRLTMQSRLDGLVIRREDGSYFNHNTDLWLEHPASCIFEKNEEKFVNQTKVILEEYKEVVRILPVTIIVGD